MMLYPDQRKETERLVRETVARNPNYISNY